MEEIVEEEIEVYYNLDTVHPVKKSSSKITITRLTSFKSSKY